MADDISGRIFAIQRYCTGDGPGIRSTVFMQGCPLHCQWCHNPESRSCDPLVSFRKASCLACGKCRQFYSGHNCRRNPEQKCSGCGTCVRECPGSALALLGKTVNADEVMKTLLRDRFYYEETGGGITLSGGEPCFQAEFSCALLEAAKKAQLHTAVETSGAADISVISRMAEFCDLWLFDIKAAPERYFELTGGDYGQIRKNLQYLSDNGAKIILRVPLVQGCNLEPALLDELKKISVLPGVLDTELLPYHDMGRGKSKMCGLPEPEWEKYSTPSGEILMQWKDELRRKKQ